VSGELFGADYDRRVAFAQLEQWLLERLDDGGRLTRREIDELLEQHWEPRYRAGQQIGVDVDLLRLSAKRQEESLGGLMRQLRRRGLIVADPNEVDSDDQVVEAPEWRLTEAGAKRLEDIRASQQTVPRRAITRFARRVGDQGVGTLATLVAVSAPAFFLAWFAGAIQDPGLLVVLTFVSLGLLATIAVAWRRSELVHARDPARKIRLEETEKFFQQAEETKRFGKALLEDVRQLTEDIRQTTERHQKEMEEIDKRNPLSAEAKRFFEQMENEPEEASGARDPDDRSSSL
jgi:hypothetical protein